MVASLSATLLATSPTGKVPSPENSRFPMWRLMDARSIAATARNGGVLTLQMSCPHIPADRPDEHWDYDPAAYQSRVYFGVGKPQPQEAGIWPQHRRLAGAEFLCQTTCCSPWPPPSTIR